MHKILIVDDEIGILDLCKRVLSNNEYIIQTTNSSIEALEILKKDFFDMVLSDLKMPGLNGIEMMKEIKELSPHTEIIIITGQATIETAIESLKSGAFDYIMKPFNIDELISSTEKCIEYGQLRRRESIFRELTYLYQLAQEISKTKTEKELIEFILDRIVKALKADTGSIYMYIPAQQNLVCMAACGNSEYINYEMEFGEKTALWVAEQKEAVIIQDGLANFSQLRDIAVKHDIISSMVCPLINHDMLLGIVSLNRFSAVTKYIFTQHDLNALKDFMLHATLIIAALRHQHALMELDNLKSEFMANVSHELRTPLMAISGALELLNTYSSSLITDEKTKMFIDLITRNTERMRSLVNNLLDFAKMETKTLKLFKTRFDLSQLITENIQDFSVKAQSKQLKLESNSIKNPGMIFADRERLRQVVSNLINNAIKFTPEGGVIHVDYEIRENNDVVITVEDSGIGIEKDKQEKIFEKFYQVDGSVRRVQSGFGLGLAIVKSIVDAHEGKIWLESDLGKGTKFFVLLPSAYSENKDVPKISKNGE